MPLDSYNPFLEIDTHPMESTAHLGSGSFGTAELNRTQLRVKNESFPILLTREVVKTASTDPNYPEDVYEIEIARSQSQLCNEAHILQILAERGNTYVPCLMSYDEEHSALGMTFVEGPDGYHVSFHGNMDTAIDLMLKYVESVESVLDDNITNLDYSPGNFIVALDRNGHADRITLIDFGSGLEVHDGKVAISRELVASIYGVPPEVAHYTGTETSITVDAESLTVFVLGHSFTRLLGGSRHVTRDRKSGLSYPIFIKDMFLMENQVACLRNPELPNISTYSEFLDLLELMQAEDPKMRPQIVEVQNSLRRFCNDSKVGSCIKANELNTLQQIYDSRSRTYVINEVNMNEALDRLKK